jgi:protein-disulfide isomerase
VRALRRSPLWAVVLLGSSIGCSGDRTGWNVEPPTDDASQAVQRGLGPFAAPPASPPQEAVNVTGLGYDQGAPTARVTVVEFSDFGCGYCRRFHESTFPVLKEEFIDTGRVRWKYVPFSIGMFPNGSEAALAGDCAGDQGGFLAMKARLYGSQAEWRGSREPFDLFESYAEAQGLDGGRFAACLLDTRRHERLETSNRTASQLGVRGTPTFFVQGFPVQGAIPLDMFRNILNEMLDRVGGTGGPTPAPPG